MGARRSLSRALSCAHAGVAGGGAQPGPSTTHAGWGSGPGGREPGTGVRPFSYVPRHPAGRLCCQSPVQAQPLARGHAAGDRTRSSEPRAARPGAPDPRVGQQPLGLNLPTVKGPAQTTPSPLTPAGSPRPHKVPWFLPRQPGSRPHASPSSHPAGRGKPGEKWPSRRCPALPWGTGSPRVWRGQPPNTADTQPGLLSLPVLSLSPAAELPCVSRELPGDPCQAPGGPSGAAASRSRPGRKTLGSGEGEAG